MADTTFGSCCVDEVGALHINAECVIHYGHTCLSSTSKLPAFFVFGKSPISISSCAEKLLSYASAAGKPVLVLYGLDYTHVILDIKEALLEATKSIVSKSKLEIHVADVICSSINPSENSDSHSVTGGLSGFSSQDNDVTALTINNYRIGGLTWNLPLGSKMEDYLLFWIGPENPAFANVVLTFNGCEIVRYDATEDHLVTDFSRQRRILKRRYFLVEKAKDANMVGILVGTLGVAGYLHVIDQMKELVTRAGKKAYTLAMGRPNPAKLANFPECDVFIYVSCAQTAMLDSKEFLAPVITPFEAMLAFKSGGQWTGEYVMEFRDLIDLSPVEGTKPSEEARFSFLQGGYVEDHNLQDDGSEETEGVLAMTNETQKTLQLHDRSHNSVVKGIAKSGAEFFATRSYHGLDMESHNPSPETFVRGRSGRASGYDDERSK
ncbi:2-(3-amino-3-carboxypropyl)histidine synthase subunit 2-like isoform X1 [Punica granatum]|nr:2-(3-amino-3-carboxypropyl)histidine synthase subunit 2-like isoform X1 [Punica granatum]